MHNVASADTSSQGIIKEMQKSLRKIDLDTRLQLL